MAVLNLRNVPDDVMQRLRISAAKTGEKLHHHAVRLIEEATALRATDPDRSGRVIGVTVEHESGQGYAALEPDPHPRLEIEIT